MSLSGVLYVGRNPTAYIAEVPAITPGLMRGLQQTVWNQAIVPILLLADPAKVYVFSSSTLPARKDQDPNDPSRFVDILDRAAQALEIGQLARAIETGRLFQDHAVRFDRGTRVDQYLLRNLDAVAERLSGPGTNLTVPDVHALLTRLLFACYLIERGMVKAEHFADTELRHLSADFPLGKLLNFLDTSKASRTLFSLFGELKKKFNGSLFETDLPRLSIDCIKAIQGFLRGDDLGDKQLALGFWAYDFSVIPVETISAIYENFIGNEGVTLRRQSGAYYTPPHLVELTLDVATEAEPGELLGKTVLDPACGSGIFLVAAFNRMAEEWRRKNPDCDNAKRARELVKVLQERIFGVEIHETACLIACFSLYLALLDQLDPPDIEALEKQGPCFPRLLLHKDQKPVEGEPRSIICRNFFDPNLPVQKAKFDLIVGNPPWVSRDKSTDSDFLIWMEREPDVLAPQKQMAHGFMWQSIEYLTQAGKACLVLPTTVLLNKTDKFQRRWFEDNQVERVVDLSDLRHLLFTGADHAATIIKFARKASSPTEWIAYESPKTAVFSQLGGPVCLREEDVTRVPLVEILSEADRGEAPMVWKKRLWGTTLDLRFLDRLAVLPRLEDIAGEPGERKRWIKGQGFQPFNPKPSSDLEKIKAKKEPERSWWSPKELFLEARSDIGLLVLKRDCFPVGNRFPWLLFPRDCRLYNKPLVIVSQGFSKSAYVDFPVLFLAALQSIKGPPRDAGLLMFLAAVLGSNLAKYFLFHTASNWGTERDKVHFFELLRLPFPLPESMPDPGQSQGVIDKVVKRMSQLKDEITQPDGEAVGRVERVAAARREIEPLIHDYYGLDDDERALIDETVNIIEPSSTPTSPESSVPTLHRTTPEQRDVYVKTLCEVLSGWASRSKETVSGNVVCAPFAGLGIVTLTKGTSRAATQEQDAPEEVTRRLKRINQLLAKQTGMIVRQRGMKVFDGDRIHIVKTLTLRGWTKTAALNDAEEIAASILRRHKGGQ